MEVPLVGALRWRVIRGAMVRVTLAVLGLAAVAATADAQRRPRLDVALVGAASSGASSGGASSGVPSAASGELAATVRVQNALGERYVRDLLGNGFPARLHYRAELWSTGGFFNSMQRRAEWDVLVRFDALGQQYEVVRVRGDSATARDRFARFEEMVADVERAQRIPIAPVRGKSQYYSVTLELEMLSVSDLDEVERWLRGELKPAVRGERNPGTAVGRGMRTLLARVLGGEMRRLDARSKTFKP